MSIERMKFSPKRQIRSLSGPALYVVCLISVLIGILGLAVLVI